MVIRSFKASFSDGVFAFPTTNQPEVVRQWDTSDQSTNPSIDPPLIPQPDWETILAKPPRVRGDIPDSIDNYPPMGGVNINPVIAPVNNSITNNTSTNINTNISYDQELSIDQRTVLNVLFTSLVTGSAAMVFGENPWYFGSMGALMAAVRILRPNELASSGIAMEVKDYVSPATMMLAGGVLVSKVMGKSALESAVILGAGAFLGPVL